MNTFTHLIITAPTSDLAAVYKSQLEVVRSKLLCLQGCELFCVADPSGVRIGSGGGTLNALHYLDVIIGRSSLSKAKVAIIHSGGDSKRAPFHTVCGKAWASINALQGDQLLGTPLTMLIEELVMFCKNILSSSCSSGSIVVASSDVMLDICIGEDGKLPVFLKFPENAVSVVGVPESPEVARNHGVLVGKQFGNYNSKASQYLQKPDMNQMLEAGAIFKNENCNGEDAVYIDTGVVIFTGLAVHSFLSLLDNPLVNICTSKGLVDKYSSPVQIQSSSTTVVTALRLELYSDILHAYALCDAPNDLETYLSVLGVSSTSASSENLPYVSALKVIWNVLHSCPLHLIQVPRGIFCHLGTSSELLNLLSSCTDYVKDVEDEIVNDKKAVHESEGDRRLYNKRQFSINSDSSDSDENKDELKIGNIDKLKIFSKKYSLHNFVRSSVFYQKDSEPYVTINQLDSTDVSLSKDFQGVIINSILILENVTSHENGNSFANGSSLIEHSILSGIFNVGFRSVISHFPGFLGSHLKVLDNMMMQYVPVKYGDVMEKKSDENEFLVLVFGIDDDIKSYYLEEHSTICGVPWNVLFNVRAQNFCS